MKWEYRVHNVDNDGDEYPTFSLDYLNELGDDGWELVHVNKLQNATAGDESVGGTLTRTKRVVLWFKRPKPD